MNEVVNEGMMEEVGEKREREETEEVEALCDW